MNSTTDTSIMDEPITASQRRALFAIGKSRGLTTDDLRAMTPKGSISSMTRGEASDILDNLNRGTTHEHPRKRKPYHRRPKGVYAIVTEAQRRKIESLMIELGWGKQKLHDWLAKRHHEYGRPMTSIHSTTDGVAVIELLKGVLARSQRPRRRVT